MNCGFDGLNSGRGQRGLIGDDLVAKVAAVAQLPDLPPLTGASLGAGVAVGALLGLSWALSWMFLARRLAGWLGEPPLAERPPGAIAAPRVARAAGL